MKIYVTFYTFQDDNELTCAENIYVGDSEAKATRKAEVCNFNHAMAYASVQTWEDGEMIGSKYIDQNP